MKIFSVVVMMMALRMQDEKTHIFQCGFEGREVTHFSSIMVGAKAQRRGSSFGLSDIFQVFSHVPKLTSSHVDHGRVPV